MILEEIEENLNCSPCDMMRFRENGPARRVVSVRLHHEETQGRLYQVAGWTHENQPVAAFVRPVEDSGSGVAYLLYGGQCGLRFKPHESGADWSLADATQWGEPYLLLADSGDLFCEEA